MEKKKNTRTISVESLRHQDTRINIPTEELRDFVAEDEQAPETLLYPRDPSLDPQLVWKGKDEQDRTDLAVPVVPIYIQEKIHPQAIIEDLRRVKTGSRPAERQMRLFDDFNGIDFEQLIDFYHHEQHWSNRMILGDSLLVMASLAEKEGLKGKVQMIYIDPPYGIKFGSNWQVSTRKRDVKDGKPEDATRQPEQIRAFRDTWKLGIHSYLAYLRDRLVVARELLTETGSVFVQIGDENVHLVRCLLDEVFGGENFVSQIVFEKTGAKTSGLLDNVFDVLLFYAKNKDTVKYRQLYLTRDETTGLERYNYVELPTGESIKLTKAQLSGSDAIPQGRRWRDTSVLSQGESAGKTGEPICLAGKTYYPKPGRHWCTSKEGFNRLWQCRRVVEIGNLLQFRRFADDFPVVPLKNKWEATMIGTETTYVVQTATKVIERCILMTTDPGDLVLDPTCGSGTTAYVAEQWGRRWITIDTSRVALALARTRLMSARYSYYLLADSPEGSLKEAELTGKLPPPCRTSSDIRKGFVYKRVPHVTLKSIANNPEIDEIHSRFQAQSEPLRTGLNRLLGQSWEEWQIPREAGAQWPEEAQALHGGWWQLRRERQQAIDASIARHADRETLYDQPYEDSKRVRVTGPFTVESLSPHRVLSTDADADPPATEGTARRAAIDFATMVIENLHKAGVQNTRKNERLRFDCLSPFAGRWIQAAGEYTDADGKVRRAAVSIGPEHGTVGPYQVKEAAKEALQGVGFDLLVVCGFAFDAHAGETATEFSPQTKESSAGITAEQQRQYGKLQVLLARMNPDLAMGDELLKKTGAGNLFMIFGEPDVDIQPQQDGKSIIVKLKGVDIYDPTTGQIRSSSTDDIACWFIDTDYNGESFFVRHAYFSGADRPYDKLKRALRAEIDESAWLSLYSTTSRPFERPKSGKIAVKVINHYGDEVLKVYIL
ncbi:MAG: site-specific DNA-methyltransferase [bacterium]